MRGLADNELPILNELLSQAPVDGTGVDAVVFRVAHHKELSTLDRLEQDGFIRKVQDRYVVGLMALVRMDSRLARAMLARAECLYVALRSRYMLEPKRPVALVELAEDSKTSLGDTRQVLLYMLESPTWSAGQSPSLLDGPDAYLSIAEEVLRHDSFASLIAQLEEWRSCPPLNQLLHVGVSPTAGTGAIAAVEPTSLEVTSGKPAWFGKLPSNVGAIMGEIYAAMGMQMRILPAMGVRTAFDVLFVELLDGDVGSFEQKVSMLTAKNLISPSERQHVLAALDVGSASAHRGHMPDKEDLETILAVCERLLHAHYILPSATQRLRANTPRRHVRKQGRP